MSKFIRVFAAGVLLAGLPMAALAQVQCERDVRCTVKPSLQCSSATC